MLELIFGKGLLLHKQKRYSDAVEAFSKAIALNFSHHESYWRRGAAKLPLKDLAGASLDCAEALKLNPRDAQAYTLMGLIKIELKDYEAAIEEFKLALALDPSLNLPRVYLALAMTDMDEAPAAIPILEPILGTA